MAPIFEVVAGQTSCDREKRVRSSKANVHYLEYWINLIRFNCCRTNSNNYIEIRCKCTFGYNIDPNPWNDQRMKKLKDDICANQQEKYI
jgi:hypothetical protein